ncbi:hypothetical protein Tco_1041477 [Tanacetum coccineum]|uniref:Uncharacterized protein n=1 Tax=Tanacetum coccineum TaxID=301880 RepID=A0ABQ5GIN3_9ASTR
MGRFTYNQLKNKSFEEIQKLYEKEQNWIKDFIPMDSEEGEKKATSSSSEEQSAEKEKELSEEELQKLLVDLVKKRFSTTEPTDDKERELWVELKRLFEPDNNDILWKLQRYMHDHLVWRLYDTCGVQTIYIISYVRFDNQSIERNRLIEIGFVLDFMEFISFTFSDKEMILMIEVVSR